MTYRKIYAFLMLATILGCILALWFFDQPGYGAKHRMGALFVTAIVMYGLTRRFFVGLRDDD